MSLFMGMNRIMSEISVAAARHGRATPAIDRYLAHQCSEEHFTDLFAEKSEKPQENPQEVNDNKASVIFPEAEVEKVLDKAVKALEEAAAEVATQQATKNDPKTVVVDEDDDDDEPTEMEILLKPTKCYPAKSKKKNKNKAAAAAKEAAKKVG